VTLALFACSAAACDPFGTGFEDVEPATLREENGAEPAPAPEGSIRVLDWNVKFGGGRIDFFFDCWGDRVLMERDEVIGNLEGIAAKIREVDPDVVFLQEVDVNAKRSAFVDQVAWLLEHTDLRYGAYASQWRADFVPSDGIGPVDSGNAILSRWPIEEATRIALPLRTDQSGLTQYFYLRRNVLRARVRIPDASDLWLVNVHTDAYGEDGTKRLHIDRFADELDALDDAGELVVGGGDLNTLPPGTEQLFDFPDSVCEDEEFIADDYRPEVGWLDALYGRYAPFVSTADYAADNAAYYSHTVDGRGFWNRQLDYLFTNAAWAPGSGVVHQDARTGMETMPLSDHAPISAELALP
jgi:endonuclease/exonuclease/phosphatase family metal-dependent hydrolase